MLATPSALDPRTSAQFLRELGFLLTPDLPDESASLPAYLLVALREHPTLDHFDPERVEYWVNANGRGSPGILDRSVPLPFEETFQWGVIRIIDRLEVSNEYVTFGGHVSAAPVDGVAVAVFASPAPILCSGGHSQAWDPGSQSLAAFFGRLRAAVGASRAVETQVGAASPMGIYAAWIGALVARYRTSDLLRSIHPATFLSLDRRERNLRSRCPLDWDAGHGLLRAAGFETS